MWAKIVGSDDKLQAYIQKTNNLQQAARVIDNSAKTQCEIQRDWCFSQHIVNENTTFRKQRVG